MFCTRVKLPEFACFDIDLTYDLSSIILDLGCFGVLCDILIVIVDARWRIFAALYRLSSSKQANLDYYKVLQGFWFQFKKS